MPTAISSASTGRLRATDEVIERVKAGSDKGQFQRMCISMITHPNSNADTFVLLEQWVREVPQVPVSILSNPTTLEKDDLVRMRESGPTSSRWRSTR